MSKEILQPVIRKAQLGLWIVMTFMTLLIGGIIYALLPPLGAIEMTQAVSVGYEDCVISTSGPVNHYKYNKNYKRNKHKHNKHNNQNNQNGETQGYQDIFRFEHNNIEYTVTWIVCTSGSWSNSGAKKTIFYDGNNPNNVTELFTILCILVIWFMMVCGSIVIFVFIKRKVMNGADSSTP